MLQQYSTALIALSSSLHTQTLLQQLSNLRIQPINKAQIHTKENILLELETLTPNFLFVSANLPGVIEVIEVITKAKQTSPKTKVVLFINENDSKRILNYLLGQVDAIIWSENILDSIESAIRQIFKDQLFICGRSTTELRTLLQEQKMEEKSDLGLLNLLTDREVEVLQSLTQGTNYKQISKLLFISESTVKTHINNIFTKLNVNDRTQAVLYALHHSIESLTKKPHILKNLTNETVQI